MNYHYHLKLLGILSLFAIGAPAVQASGVTCPSATLDVYLNSFLAPGSGCTQGSLSNIENFGFTFETRSTGDNSDVASNISVNPDNANAILGFGGFEQLSPNQGDLDYFIGFNIDPPPVLSGDSIALDPFTAGTATLNLYVCQGDTPYFLGDDDGTFECGSNFGIGFSGGLNPINLNNPDASISETFGDPMASVSFPPTSQVGFLLELQLTSGTVGTGQGTIGNAPMMQSPIPEPATVVMFGSGLAGAILLRKFIQNRLRAR